MDLIGESGTSLSREPAKIINQFTRYMLFALRIQSSEVSSVYWISLRHAFDAINLHLSFLIYFKTELLT